MKHTISLFTFLILCCFLSLTSCSKDESNNRDTLEEIYKTYENGMISECMYEGEIVYTAYLNANDAGGSIIDFDGNAIGICNYAWGPVDSICTEVESCKVIYRVEDNIWGLPAVNLYSL